MGNGRLVPMRFTSKNYKTGDTLVKEFNLGTKTKLFICIILIHKKNGSKCYFSSTYIRADVALIVADVILFICDGSC